MAYLRHSRQANYWRGRGRERLTLETTGSFGRQMKRSHLDLQKNPLGNSVEMIEKKRLYMGGQLETGGKED